MPFEIPESWEWERIGNIFTLQAGKSIKSAEIVDTPFPNSYPCYGGNGIRGFVSNKNRKGDFPIIGRQGALCGNIKRAKGEFYATEHAVCVETYAETSVEWTCFFLTALNLNQYATATAQPGLAVSNINRIIIPIPPLAEQHRIAAKIEELLPYVEKYEQVENQLSALNTAFPELLKKSIFQEAVMGKLVPQNPDDEPASVLLDCIRAEKQELIKQGKIKPDKHESIIFKRDNSHYERIGDIERCIDDELPFEIPESWEWCRLNCIVSKEIKRGKAPKYDDGGKNLVFAQKCNVKSGGINLSLAKNLSDAAFSKYPVEEYLIDGDIVVNSTGNGTLGRIGIFRDYDRINDSTVVPDSHVTVIRIIKSIRFKYLYYTLKWYQPYLEKTCEGSTNQTELKPAIISSLLIPVPPLSEQIRIIHQIENLMNLTSQL